MNMSFKGIFQTDRFNRELNYQSDKDIRFFIVSSGRSGSTLLRNMLMQSAIAHIPPESDDRLVEAIKIFHRNASWNDRVEAVLSDLKAHPAFKSWNIDFHSIADSLNSTSAEQQTLNTILNEVYWNHASLNGYDSVSVIGDKTPYLVNHISDILAIYPFTKFIFMKRDPRSVVSSMILMKKGRFTLESAIQRWKAANSKALKASSRIPQKFKLVSYEDLINNTKPTLSEICSFIDVPYSDSMLKNSAIDLGDDYLSHHKNVKKPISEESLDKWKTNLTKNEIQTINRKCKKLMTKLNYDL